jgi:hypothetical protein
MPDNWGFVVAAYLVTALALGAYWRGLGRRERELAGLADRPEPGGTGPSPRRRDPSGRAQRP